MSMIMNLTDDEWYCFICGFQAGLRVKDIQAPLFQSETVLHPIAVGGQGQRGLGVSDVYTHQGQSSYVTTVFTHDIDVEYSGFSCLIKFDPSVMQVTGVTEGQFGTISTQGNTDIRYEVDNVNGYFYALGLKPASVKYKKQQALFFISWNISTLPQNGEPYYIEFTGGQASTAGSTLLQYYEHDGIQDLQVISPCLNSRGTVYSPDTPVQLNEAKMGDESVAALGASPIIQRIVMGPVSYFLGNEPALGTRQIRGIDCYYLPDTLGTYVYCTIKIPTEWPDEIFSFINITGSSSFDVVDVETSSGTCDIEVYQDGEIVTQTVNALVIEVTMERVREALRWYFQPETLFYMNYEFNLVDPIPPEGYIPMICTQAGFDENTTGSIYQEIRKVNGYLPYHTGQTAVNNPYYVEEGRAPTGISGSGKVWASQPGIAYIGIAGTDVSFPVYLEAGENDITFQLPFESSEPIFEQIQLTIEAEGYVEIQQGFTWNVYSSLDAPKEPMPVKPIDDLKFVDLHDVLIIHHAGPISDQDEIDDLPYEDFHDVDLITAPGTYDVDEADSIEFEDLHSIDIQYGPRVYNLAELDDLELNDLYEVIKHEVFNGESRTTEEASFEDFVDIDM